MQCLIVAAGRGQRISSLGDSKPLVPLLGTALIEWVVRGAQAGGAQGFVVVTGYNAEPVEAYLRDLSRRHNVPITAVRNPDWRRGNGSSLLQARDQLEGASFALLMVDHLFEPEALRDLCAQPLGDGEVLLGVDTRTGARPDIDMDDVTRVLVEAGHIVDIGKGISRYNAFDTGMFWCDPGLFAVAAAEHQQEPECSISAVLRRCGKAARVFDMGGRLWMDVDTEQDLQRAESVLARRPEISGGHGQGMVGDSA